MHSNLARAFLAKGVIRQGTVVDAMHQVRGLSCVRNAPVMASFVTIRVRLQDQSRVVFDVLDADRQPCQIAAEQVLAIDGMLVARIALSHHLTLEGEELAKRPRRGRRKKSVDELQAA